MIEAFIIGIVPMLTSFISCFLLRKRRTNPRESSPPSSGYFIGMFSFLAMLWLFGFDISQFSNFEIGFAIIGGFIVGPLVFSILGETLAMRMAGK